MAVTAVKEEMRKGPWAEQEDLQLVCYVGLFGERRWDFIAKVSGLNRTGKSCRLRWVNYLHPGLKRGHMTPEEERLVLELHSRWGNRWSRIARRLPGRTDNEIKNYWRTHMRKIAQEKKKNSPPSCFSSSSSYLSSSSTEPPLEVGVRNQEHSIIAGESTSSTGFAKLEEGVKSYPMDQIWSEIAPSESVSDLSFKEAKDEAGDTYFPPISSPVWDHYRESLWISDDEEFRMYFQWMTY